MATYSWAAAVSGDWSVATDWTPAGPPPAGSAVVIDAPTTAPYDVTIAAGENEAVQSLSMNGVNNLLGSNTTAYSAAELTINGVLTFAAGSPGSLGGSLQTYIIMGNGSEMVNPGTVNGFIQAEGNVHLTGTNGIYITNWLQALGGVVTVDTTSIAELSGNTLFDGIFEAVGSGSAVNLGGPLQKLAVDITTVEGPPANAAGWTEVIFDGVGSGINEYNGTTYVPLESTLTTIGSRGTVDVLGGRGYGTANPLTIEAGGLLNLNAGSVSTGGIDINGGVIQGFGTIAGAVTNNGTLRAEGGVMALLSPLTGTGVVDFDFNQQKGTTSATGATLSVNTVGAGQVITMNGDDTLILTTPSAFAGTIAAKLGDTITFDGITANAATVSGNSLLLQDNGTTVDTVAIAGNYAGEPISATPVAGGTNVNIGTSPAPVTGFTVVDTTTGSTTTTAGTPYSGPVAGLQSEFITTTTDSLAITATTPNVFIHTGSGNDAIDVSKVNGTNVLDGGGGSNFLVGGTGNDTFFGDARGATTNVFSTVVNFHSGDNATIFGVDPTNYTMTEVNNAGAAGYLGVAFGFTAPGLPTVNIVLTGYSTADLTNGRLSTSFGTTTAEPGAPAANYFLIHGN